METLLYLSMRLLKAFDNRRTDVGHLKPDAVRNILIVSSTAVGDTLLSTPAIRAVRKSYPKARIIALFNAANMELFANNPNIDAIIPYYGGYRRFFSTIRKVRAYSPDLALILHGNEPQATPMSYLAGASFILKLPNVSPFAFLLSNRPPLQTCEGRNGAAAWKDVPHGIEARLKTAGLALCKADGLKMDIFTDECDEAAANGFLKEAGVKDGDVIIGFQPGASTLSRQWFPERFIELGKRLRENSRRVHIVLTGSPAERRMCEDIAEGIGGREIVAAGRLPLRQVAPLIKRFNVFVTGDTGPMHIAFAVGTPVVALFAVSDPRVTGPLYDAHRHRVIKKPRTCDPCVSKKCAYQKCMEAITVDEVCEAVRYITGITR
ncbi:MAG: glycosyltransferase family 9 protein [Deltaproteobacteria bacterium]|nr:glycosyltransferase family 9 protein [Deltaproteobacteria bacterium]